MPMIARVLAELSCGKTRANICEAPQNLFPPWLSGPSRFNLMAFMVLHTPKPNYGLPARGSIQSRGSHDTPAVEQPLGNLPRGSKYAKVGHICVPKEVISCTWTAKACWDSDKFSYSGLYLGWNRTTILTII